MQDRLIGYLLGALSDEQMAQVERELAQSETLRQQLRLAAESLRPLKRDPDDIEPPPGLVDATMDQVFATGPTSRPVEVGRSSERDEWSLVDITIAASVLLAGCLLFFPAVNNSRYHAQIAACQNNLRSIGQALIEYSSTNAQELFPRVPETGNLAVAGMYAPTLMGDEFVTADHTFYCPALPVDQLKRIPTLAEIDQSVGRELAELQRRMGGDYGYTLGVHKSGRLYGVRNLGRAQYAIMSDAPLGHVDLRRRSHQNVLFESGAVRALTNAHWYGDQLYRNERGEVSAGVHEADIVIGASGTAPLQYSAYVRMAN